jgi:polysaccharide pyruvyl transferase WcaK-like protein
MKVEIGVNAKIGERLKSDVSDMGSPEPPMQPKTIKISFFGRFGQKNLGNECTLQAIIYHARRYFPTVQINCIGTDPEDISTTHGIPSFPTFVYPKTSRPRHPLLRLGRKVFLRIPMELLNWIKAFQTLKGTDMLVMPGTGMITDYAEAVLGFPYAIFQWSLLAKLRGCKLFYVSVGAGPISHPLSRFFLKSALSLADYRSYRDSRSRAYMESVGCDAASDLVFPDLAFSLPKAIFPASEERPGQRLVIGVGLMDYFGRRGQQQGNESIYHNYIDTMIQFVTRLVEKNYTVRVLIGDAKFDTSVKQELMESLDKSGIGRGGQILEEPISSVDELMSQLARTDIVVSPRFHNLLLALMLGKPALALSYNEKIDSLMCMMDLPQYCLDLDHLDVRVMVEKIVELDEKAESLRAYIREKSASHRSALEKQYNLIFGEI